MCPSPFPLPSPQLHPILYTETRPRGPDSKSITLTGRTISTDTLGKSKVTGVKQVDNLQDGVNNLVAGQVGQDGLLQPVGDALSKEGLNRAERQGKGEDGSYAPGPAGSVVNPVAEGGKKVGGGLVDGGKAAGGFVGGLFSGAGKQQGQK